MWKASLFASEGSGLGPRATKEDPTCLDFLLIFQMAQAKLTGQQLAWGQQTAGKSESQTPACRWQDPVSFCIGRFFTCLILKLVWATQEPAGGCLSLDREMEAEVVLMKGEEGARRTRYFYFELFLLNVTTASQHLGSD